MFLLLFALTIPAANWLIGHAGTYCVPDGPCLVPVAPGLMAPSGVTMIGLALVLRDLVQRRLGIHTAAAAILAGSLISALLAPPLLVLASAAAFLLSEMADLGIYTPLARRRLVLAVLASSTAGLVVELDHLPLAGIRFAGVPARPDRGQGLDGAALHAVRCLAAAARSSPRPRAGLSIIPGGSCHECGRL